MGIKDVGLKHTVLKQTRGTDRGEQREEKHTKTNGHWPQQNLLPKAHVQQPQSGGQGEFHGKEAKHSLLHHLGEYHKTRESPNATSLWEKSLCDFRKQPHCTWRWKRAQGLQSQHLSPNHIFCTAPSTLLFSSNRTYCMQVNLTARTQPQALKAHKALQRNPKPVLPSWKDTATQSGVGNTAHREHAGASTTCWHPWDTSSSASCTSPASRK